mmetsp:Transcript_7404/g.20549  ORF Transcript_7404/g.20549 Transcript_7404/m.20549 type:complete len:550 (-) Transcript_7404:215-1864(-)
MQSPSLRRSRSSACLGLASSTLTIAILTLVLTSCAAAATTGTASSISSHDHLAKPIHSFSFANQSLVDEIGSGVLRAESGGSVTTSSSASGGTSAYTFGRNGGPTLLNIQLTDGDEYTIEMSVSLVDPLSDGEGTIKAVDFANLQSDYGVYVIDGRLGYIAAGGIQSSPSSSPTAAASSTNMQAGMPTHIAITRRADTRIVAFFTNGIEVLSMIDSSNDFVVGSSGGDSSQPPATPPPTQPFRIFQDDTDDFCAMLGRPPRCDSGSGSIDYIKIYGTALTSDAVAVLHVQGKHEPEVAACLCDSTDGICIDEDHAVLGQLLSLCIRCSRDDFVVASVNDFRYEQGVDDGDSGGSSPATVEVAVGNGMERTGTVILQRDGYMLISTILSEQFYSSGSILPIVGRGSVDLTINPIGQTSEDDQRDNRGGRSRRSLQPSQIRIAATFVIVFDKFVNDDDFGNDVPTPQNIGSSAPTPMPSAFAATRPPHLLEPTDRPPTTRQRKGLVVNLVVSAVAILLFGSVTCGIWKVGRYVMETRQRAEAAAGKAVPIE